MLKVDRTLILLDIIAIAKTQKNLSKVLGIKAHLIQGWLYDNTKIELHYAMKMLSFYRKNGYVLTIKYTNIPQDEEIQENIIYLYSDYGFLMYALRDKAEKVRKIKIMAEDLGEHYSEIKSILESGACGEAQLSSLHRSLITQLTAKNYFYIKKGYTFSVFDLSTHITGLTAEDFLLAAGYDEKPLLISERVSKLRQDMLAYGHRRGRKKKNKTGKHTDFKGKTIDLFYKKWHFQSPDDYFRAAKVVDYGDSSLIRAMDLKEVTVSRACKIVKEIIKNNA